MSSTAITIADLFPPNNATHNDPHGAEADMLPPSAYPYTNNCEPIKDGSQLLQEDPEPMQEDPEVQVNNFRTEYHPKMGRNLRLDHFEQYGHEKPKLHNPSSNKPWASFCNKLNFELSELMLEAALNHK